MARLLQSRKETVRPHARLISIYLVVILLGLGMTSGRMPGAGDAGMVTIVVGAGGCAWEIAQWLRATRRRLVAQEHTRARGELKAVRAVRRGQEQIQARRQQQTHLRATRNRARLQQAEQQTKRHYLLNLEGQRKARFETVSAEAARLQALSDAHLLDTLPSIFAVRGLRLQSVMPFAENMRASEQDGQERDLRFMRLTDETFEVARCLPQGQTVTVADVESLEQWRQSCEAGHAYLIGRNGFSAAAIRLAQHFPLTLVEPQLLAQWHTPDNRVEATL